MNKTTAGLIGLLFCSTAAGQASFNDPVDMQGWYALSFNCAPAKKWKLDADYQYRSINNLKTYNGSYISLGASRKVVKNLDLMAEYRLALVNKGTYHRGSFGFQYGVDVKKWEFGLRGLFQNQVQDFDDTAKPNQSAGYLRFRFGAKYPIAKNVVLYGSVEPIFKINGIFITDNWRDQIGIKYKINRNWKLDAFYIYRPDYAKRTYNRYFHILGLGLEYYLKGKKKG